MQSKVEIILDTWEDRENARDAINELGNQAMHAVISIAVNNQEILVRRRRAINLLATFKTQESIKALVTILHDKDPSLRCFAIHSMMEIGGRRVIPPLITKLDDSSVCLKAAQTDPYEEIDVYVSDEVVRALEKITSISFEEEKSLWIVGHRATQPWKDWWARNRKSYEFEE